MRVVADTAPLLAAADRSSPANPLAAGLLGRLGRDLVVLDVVLAEAAYMLRSRVGERSARLLLASVVAGGHRSAFLSPGLLRRAVELDEHYADLRLGLVDAAVMAYAERHELPILTFDFRDFRATISVHGPWRLVLDESQLARATDE